MSALWAVTNLAGLAWHAANMLNPSLIYSTFPDETVNVVISITCNVCRSTFNQHGMLDEAEAKRKEAAQLKSEEMTKKQRPDILPSPDRETGMIFPGA